MTRGKPSEPNWAIALVASRAASPFLRNALIGICRCGIDPAIVRIGALDADIEDVGRVAQGFGARPVRLSDGEAAGGGPAVGAAADELLTYGTAAFNSFSAHRYPLIRTLVAEGHHVVYADVDVAWLRNPLPYLERVLSHYCCAAQTEAVDEFPPLAICSGFLAFAPHPLSMRLLEAQIGSQVANIADGYRTCDQNRLRAVIFDDPQLLQSTFPLPEGLFPNGLLECVAASRDREATIVRRILPYIFHSNWTVGSANKRALLERASAWFVEDMPARAGKGLA